MYYATVASLVGYHVVVGVEEVGMIGKPAEPKHDQHNDEHLGQLKISNCDGYEQSTYKYIGCTFHVSYCISKANKSKRGPSLCWFIYLFISYSPVSKELSPDRSSDPPHE